MGRIDEEYNEYQQEYADKSFYEFLIERAIETAGGFALYGVDDSWFEALKKSDYYKRMGKEIERSYRQSGSIFPPEYYFMCIMYFAASKKRMELRRTITDMLQKSNPPCVIGEWQWVLWIWFCMIHSGLNYYSDVKKAFVECNLPEEYLLCCDMLQSFHSNAQPDRVIRLATSLSQMAPKCEMAWEVLGGMQYETESYEDAVETYEHLLHEFPDRRIDNASLFWRLEW